MPNLHSTLLAWRDMEARKRGVEAFRILSNASVDDIVRLLPRSREELISLKGIKEAKWRMFGPDILNIVAGHTLGGQIDPPLDSTSANPEVPTLEVSEFLDASNRSLGRIYARVHGEVTGCAARGNAVYFSMRDARDWSVLPVFAWASAVERMGLPMEDGMTVIVTGRPEIYKPSGRFSLRAEAIELAGEGALKAAYEQLKRELDREGYFADARKRPLPRYPRRIGLVTSRIGAAIDDVLTNLEPRGYEVVFHDARVEGVLATDSLLLAMQRVADVGVDVLVLVRGGGSLESLQAFNGKDLVRAIAEFPSPVICAIGHDRDIPLAQLVADASASTPTACAFLLNAPWRDAEHEMLTARTVLRRMSQSLPNSAHDRLSLGHQIMSSAFRSIHRVVASAQHRLAISAGARMMRVFERSAGRLSSGREMLTREYLRQLTGQRARLTLSYATLVAHDPRRLLARGYAIIRGKHGVVRRISDVVEGDRVDAYLQDGRLTLGVERIQPIVHDKTHEATRGNPESFGNSFGT